VSVLIVLGEKDIYYISKTRDYDDICEKQEESVGQEILVS
jgi:hypothetical protein